MSRLARSSRYVRRLLSDHSRAGGLVREVHYSRPTGLAAATWLVPAGGEAACRAVTILAHGTGNDRFYPLVAVIRQLLAMKYAVFTFDLDGHGRESSHSLVEADAATMFESAVGAARGLLPDCPLVLMGHSLGALLVLGAMARVPAKAAVLLSPPLSGRIGDRNPISEVCSLARPAWWRALGDYGPLGIWPALGGFRRSQYPMRHPPSGNGRQPWAYVAFVDALAASIVGGFDLSLAMPPTLLLYGGRDSITPPDQAATFVAGLGGRGQLVIIPGETHWTLPLAPAALTHVRDFLDEQWAVSGKPATS